MWEDEKRDMDLRISIQGIRFEASFKLITWLPLELFPFPTPALSCSGFSKQWPEVPSSVVPSSKDLRSLFNFPSSIPSGVVRPSPVVWSLFSSRLIFWSLFWHYDRSSGLLGRDRSLNRCSNRLWSLSSDRLIVAPGHYTWRVLM